MLISKDFLKWVTTDEVIVASPAWVKLGSDVSFTWRSLLTSNVLGMRTGTRTWDVSGMVITDLGGDLGMVVFIPEFGSVISGDLVSVPETVVMTSESLVSLPESGIVVLGSYESAPDFARSTISCSVSSSISTDSSDKDLGV